MSNQSMNRRRNKKNRFGNNKRTIKTGREGSAPFADDTLSLMTFYDSVGRYTNVSQTFWGKQYRMNAPNDCSETGLPSFGFKEKSEIYGRYRVFWSSISISFTNNESFPVNVVVLPVIETLGTNFGSVEQLFSSPYAIVREIAANGSMNRTTINHRFSTKKLVGEKSTSIDVGYSADTTTVPTFPLWWYVSAFTTNGASFTSVGTSVRVVVKYKTRFYSRRQLTVNALGVASNAPTYVVGRKAPEHM